MKQKIECFECGKMFVRLGRHLINHSMTSSQYRSKYPGARTITEEASRKQSAVMTRINYEILAYDEDFKARRIARCSLQLEELHLQKDFSERHSVRMSLLGRKMMIRNHKNPEFTRRNSERLKKLWSDPIFRKQAAVIALENRRGHRTVYNGIHYLSKLEARWAAIFDKQERPFKYEPKMFPYVDPHGVSRWYTPDFYMIDTDSYYEVKADKFKGDDIVLCKLQGVLDAGYLIEIITEKDFPCDY